MKCRLFKNASQKLHFVEIIQIENGKLDIINMACKVYSWMTNKLSLKKKQIKVADKGCR